MTVRENMGFALKLAKTPKAVIDQKVGEAARILDLTDYLDRKPANLSGGQRQRVAMGRAIVRDPSAFLMDEPLSNLDAKLRVQMRTEVSRIQRRLGTTMVYVTHDQTEAMTLGDRVAVMRAGLLQQVASPQELYDRPVNLFVAGFIGSPAMNFMAGTVEDGGLHTSIGVIPISGRLRQELESSRTGREVIVGIRPENFQDASLVPADVLPNGITFQASIDVIESLGAEKYIYFTQDLGQAKNIAELEELARDSGRADTGPSLPGSTPRRGSPRERTPGCGPTYGRCTFSTLPPAGTSPSAMLVPRLPPGRPAAVLPLKAPPCRPRPSPPASLTPGSATEPPAHARAAPLPRGRSQLAAHDRRVAAG
jgi:multiple sugar transport system ATP-binding protein